MRNYQLYLIEDVFARHYFGREQMFFQLFKEYETSDGELREILARQIHFITKPIPTLRLHQIIHQQLNKLDGYHNKQGTYYVEKNGIVSVAKLNINDRMLTVESYGGYDAETIFFEVLRKCEHSFLAIDLLRHHYGWLKPIKERKFV